jgi:hypothetical protein
VTIVVTVGDTWLLSSYKERDLFYTYCPVEKRCDTSFRVLSCHRPGSELSRTVTTARVTLRRAYPAGHGQKPPRNRNAISAMQPAMNLVRNPMFSAVKTMMRKDLLLSGHDTVADFVVRNDG